MGTCWACDREVWACSTSARISPSSSCSRCQGHDQVGLVQRPSNRRARRWMDDGRLCVGPRRGRGHGRVVQCRVQAEGSARCRSPAGLRLVGLGRPAHVQSSSDAQTLRSIGGHDTHDGHGLSHRGVPAETARLGSDRVVNRTITSVVVIDVRRSSPGEGRRGARGPSPTNRKGRPVGDICGRAVSCDARSRS